MSGRLFFVELPFDSTVESLQQRIQQMEGIPVDEQRLTVGLRRLVARVDLNCDDMLPLSAYGVVDGSTVSLVRAEDYRCEPVVMVGGRPSKFPWSCCGETPVHSILDSYRVFYRVPSTVALHVELAGDRLLSDRVLADYGILDGTVLHVVEGR